MLHRMAINRAIAGAGVNRGAVGIEHALFIGEACAKFNAAVSS